MSRIRRGTRRSTVLAGLVVLALAGVAAFAYWTTSGEGTGEAHVANPASNLRVEGAPVEGLSPGVSKELTVSVRNASASASVHTERLESVLTGDSNELTGCKKSWFSVSPATQPLVRELGPGETETATVTVTMAAAESENQNACKGAAVHVHFLAD
jgi:hypothetical protein